MKHFVKAATLCLLLWPAIAPGGEIGFLEDFSLAKDRSVPLKQLIPGTEDYYYYHCLHYQHEGQFGEVDKMLGAWIKRYRYTPRVEEIRNRQALLRYDKDPKGSLDFIKNRLGLRFDHQKEVLDKKTNFPSRLDQNLFSRATLMKIAYSRHSNLNGFEDSALDFLVRENLSADRRRDLLRRLKRPDHANLPKLVIDDLKYRHSRGFGSHGIHHHLLLAQLDSCAGMMQELVHNGNYINTYLRKLQPSPDVDWRHDPKEQVALLDRQWAFVKGLPPSQNSLKAHVLYRRLVLDRSQGQYDKDRFMEYLKLPRNIHYVRPEYLNRNELRRYRANLSANYQQVTLHPRVQNDETLVRSYLQHFFVKENTYAPYAPYLRDEYVKEVFAETKVVNGIGDMEQWYSMLPPAKYQALKERVDIEFTPTNKTLYRADERVSLKLHVKNVESLIVKVYEINTLNFYRETGRELNTDIDLDGLVPNEEKVHAYEEPPLRRVLRTFDFRDLNRPGVFVIEFIGNGRSSRALVRKGRLRYLENVTAAGHRFVVLDDANRKLDEASLWLQGHEYRTREDGTILVPFTNKPGMQKVVLCAWAQAGASQRFSSLDSFQHRAEQYSLSAGLYVDRETLLKRKKTQVLVRASLAVCGIPTSLSVLENPTLVIESIDRSQVSTVKEVRDFKLHEDRESVYEFKVPEDLAQLNFTLKAKVQNLSQNKKIDLARAEQYTLNKIDTTEKVEDLHLSYVDGGYVLRLLGKTGEPRADRPVHLELKHRDFREKVHVVMQTDAKGTISLGVLRGIDSATAKGPEGTAHIWNPSRDRQAYPNTLHAPAGRPIDIPYLGKEKEAARDEVSLLETRGQTFCKDWFRSAEIKDGFLRITKLPPGDYDLLLKGPNAHLQLRVTDAKPLGDTLLSKTRFLQVKNAKPLQISRVETTDAEVKVKLENSSKFTRVHVAATRYLPAYRLYDTLAQIRPPEPRVTGVLHAESRYLSGRNIGDEYRYIIDRKYAKKFAGSMLERPGLLLNPWSIRKTETGEQRAAGGQAWKRSEEEFARPSGAPPASAPPPMLPAGDFPNLDFLDQSAVLLVNLRPDGDGVVSIDREALAGRQHLRVIAVDLENTAYRELSLPEVGAEFQDLRLADGLDPAKHFAEQKQITVVPGDGKFQLKDITTSKFELYDTLGKVYGLFATLSSNPTLQEFGFILNWPELKPEEKQEKYSKYACHELSFFLYRKDRPFLDRVIRPYLANKKDKTFLDHWLLSEDLSAYMKPWAFSQLNIVERALLGQRIRNEHPVMSRHVKERYDMLPPDIERFNFLFKTALKGSALEATDAFGFDKATSLSLLQKRRAPGRPGGEAKFARGAPAEEILAPKPSAVHAPKKPAAKEKEEKKARDLGEEDDEMDGEFYKSVAEDRKSVRQFYRKLEKTEEWVENNYYHLPIQKQNAALITVNKFWSDYAQHRGDQPFFSPNFAEASRSFAEMMLALAVLDLPFKAGEHQAAYEGLSMDLQAGSPMVVFHREIQEAEEAAEKTPILVSQNFFRRGDRYRHENNERLDKYVTEEFIVHTVYGCQVVLTNPTSARQKLDVLLQIPEGALPVLNGFYTRSFHWVLEPYSTRTFDYHFYFPKAGDFPHYPVHVAKNEKLVALTSAMQLKVVEKPTRIDKTSWQYLSQNGSEKDVLGYLDANNLNRADLGRIAFRMRDRGTYRDTLALLSRRHAYHHTLWSYGLYHNDLAAAREYLQHVNNFVNQCGAYIDCKLLTIDPVARKTYEHMEYKPLVNARAHRLGRRYKIVNDRFYQQYQRLLKVLSYRPKLDDTDWAAVTYYLLLQDRVDEALGFFDQINPRKVATRLQYDYLKACVSFYQEDTKEARAIAEKHREHPVDRWRNLFTQVLSQLDEIEGRGPEIQDEESRSQTQTQLAATEPGFDFQVEARKVTINYQNLTACLVNYYLMDIELLFSRNPFVQQHSGQFSYIRPNEIQTVKLPDGKTTVSFDLPAQFHNRNVMVEILAGGMKKSQPYFSNSLALQVVENYGQVRVTHQGTGKPLPKVYVKVYARLGRGAVRFYKDGYTDLRGRFDYSSLNTNLIDSVSRFSLLILSETDGAVVREAAPPKM